MNNNNNKQNNQMVFKIQLNNEIHRVDAKIASYQELVNLVNTKFQDKVPEQYFIDYKDQDGDWIRVSNEEDFSILLEDFETLKCVKLIVQQVGGKQLPKDNEFIVLNDYPEVNPEEKVEEKSEKPIKQDSSDSSSSSSSSDSDSDSNSDTKKPEGKTSNSSSISSDSNSNSDQNDENDKLAITQFLNRFLKQIINRSSNQNPLIVLRNLIKGLKFRMKQVKKFLPKEQKQLVKDLKQQIQPLIKNIFKSNKRLRKLCRRGANNRVLNQEWEALKADEKQTETVQKLNDFRSKFSLGVKALLDKVYFNNNQFKKLINERLNFLRKFMQRVQNNNKRNRCQEFRRRRHARHGSCGNKQWKRQHANFWQDVKEQCGNKDVWKQKKRSLKQMRKNMSKQEWREQVAEWKQCHGRKNNGWKKRMRRMRKNRSSSSSSFSNSSSERDQCWRKKKGFFNRGKKGGFWKRFMGQNSFEQRQKKCFMMKQWRKNIKQKVQGRIDKTIAQAIPQIAQQVAQILNVNQPEIPNDLEKQARIELAQKNNVAIHKGFTCDGCGVKPIIGVCYKSSVQKDFDFCETCEATKPHPHPFIKIRHPNQRPDAIFSIINHENEKVHPQYIQQCKGLFKDWVKDVKCQAKKAKQQFKQQMKQQNKEAKKKFKKQLKQQKQEIKKVKKQMMKAQKNQEKKDEQQKKPEVTKQPPKEAVNKDQQEQQLQDNCQKLMTVFNLTEDKKERVLLFLRNNKELEFSNLTNVFIDEFLPQLQ